MSPKLLELRAYYDSKRVDGVLSLALAREWAQQEAQVRRRHARARRGGLASARARARARKAGIASGVKRRQLSSCKRSAPRPRSRQLALALRYKVRQVGAAEFEERYRAMCEREEIPFDPRGLNSTHALYLVELTSYRAQGQDHETTNAQRAQALDKRGRPRCARTVQRLRKRLVAMGLVSYRHVRRSGAARVPGQMDSLRVRCLCPAGANVTPPTGARAANPTGVAAALACTSKATATALLPPPAAADDVGAAARPETPESEKPRSDTEVRLEWLQLKAQFSPSLLSAREAHELARLLGISGQDTDRTTSTDCQGFKWSM